MMPAKPIMMKASQQLPGNNHLREFVGLFRINFNVLNMQHHPSLFLMEQVDDATFLPVIQSR